MSDSQLELSQSDATVCTLFGRSLPHLQASSCVPLTLKYSPGRIPETVFSVSAGEGHFAVVTEGMRLYVCGRNSFGQLGVDHTRPVETPILIPVMFTQTLSDTKVEQVSCGAEHTLILTSTRDLLACGLNIKGQLGTGDTENRLVPTLVDCFHRGKSPLRGQSQRDRAAVISCGALHSAVATGFGGTLALGYGQGSDSYVFMPVTELDNIGKVERLACGVTTTGAIIQGNLYVWGTLNGTVIRSPTPVPLPPDSRGKGPQSPPLKSSTPRNGSVEDVCFSSDSCIVRAKGEVWAWGPGPGFSHPDPTRVVFPQEVVSIASGLSHAAAITSDYQLYIWGDNDAGQMCQCEMPERESAVLVRSYEGSSPFQVTCGSYTTFCLSYKPPGKLQCNKSNSPQRRSCTSTADTDCPHMEETARLRKEVEDLRRQLHEQEEAREERSKRRSRSHAYFDLSKASPKPARQLNRERHSACFEIPYEELEFLGEQIGRGGYGTVYRSKWRGTVVAVKKMKVEQPVPHDKYSEFLSIRYSDECQAMASLRHPNIVMFLGACTKPPNLCIVLEFCSRGSLWEVLRDQNTPMPWFLRCKIALDTARGMNYLHQFPVPILHRDLKSLNLLLDDCLNTKIADFGWTRFKAEIMTNKIGTYQWMAPEVISGEQYSEQADVFSYGIVLWELATRKPPYKEKSGQQVAQEVVKTGLRPPLPKKCPEQFLSLMQRCWDQRPDQRPTFARIIEELEKFLEYLESAGL